MKKVIFASLLLLNISNTFGVSIEKNGISIKYGIYRTVKLDFQFSMLGWPYYITIANHTDTPISVDASLIKAQLHSSNVIAKSIRYGHKVFSSLYVLTLMVGYTSYQTFKDMRKSSSFKPITIYPPSLGSFEGRTPFAEYLLLGSTALLAPSLFLGPLAIYKLITETEKKLRAKLEEELLHKPITIQPGKSVEKLFWLKNPKDQVEINFDTIKIIK